MEFMSGYRDPLMEFLDTMAHWFRSYQATRSEEKGWDQDSPRFPLDHSSPQWLLHLLDSSMATSTAQSRFSGANIDLSEIVPCKRQSVLMVTDSSGFPLGFDLMLRGWASSEDRDRVASGDHDIAVKITQRIVRLLRRCMEAPISGSSSRRPQGLRVTDRKLYRLLSQNSSTLSALCVALWPQVLADWGPTELEMEGGNVFSMRWPPMRYCHVCKSRSFPSRLEPCSQCKAVLYCSDKCCPADSAHHNWCDKLEKYMSNGAELANLPFTYTEEVTSEDFDMEHFLARNQLNSGYWVHWSQLVHSPYLDLHPRVEQSRDGHPHWLAGHYNVFGPLKDESNILLRSPSPQGPSLTSPLVSWRQYCEWRGLSLASPVAALLSSPLSIYYIITSLLPRDFPELNILQKQSLKIHIIESHREFQSMMVFWELSILLPHMTFEVLFVGERFPPECDGQHLLLHKKGGCLTLTSPSFTPEGRADKRSIRIKGYQRAYHMLKGPRPDLVIGFRPAFPLHDSWLSTLPRLQSLRVPAYFCELSELSCECSQQVIAAATGGGLSPQHLNPFHCPLRITGGDNVLPWYSNAFIFHLIYKPVATCTHCPPMAQAQPCVATQQLLPANQRANGLNLPLEGPRKTRRERKQAARSTPRK